jgi:hypothetical protein
MRKLSLTYSQRVLLCFVALLTALVCFGCSTKSNPAHPIDGEGGIFLLDDDIYFHLNSFQTYLDSAGTLHQGLYYDSGEEVGVIFIAGLWMGATPGGQPAANIIWSGSYPYSNYTTRWEQGNIGVYYIDPIGILDPDRLAHRARCPGRCSGRSHLLRRCHVLVVPAWGHHAHHEHIIPTYH